VKAVGAIKTRAAGDASRAEAKAPPPPLSLTTPARAPPPSSQPDDCPSPPPAGRAGSAPPVRPTARRALLLSPSPLAAAAAANDVRYAALAAGSWVGGVHVAVSHGELEAAAAAVAAATAAAGAPGRVGRGATERWEVPIVGARLAQGLLGVDGGGGGGGDDVRAPHTTTPAVLTADVAQHMASPHTVATRAAALAAGGRVRAERRAPESAPAECGGGGGGGLVREVPVRVVWSGPVDWAPVAVPAASLARVPVAPSPPPNTAAPAPDQSSLTLRLSVPPQRPPALPLSSQPSSSPAAAVAAAPAADTSGASRPSRSLPVSPQLTVPDSETEAGTPPSAAAAAAARPPRPGPLARLPATTPLGAADPGCARLTDTRLPVFLGGGGAAAAARAPSPPRLRAATASVTPSPQVVGLTAVPATVGSPARLEEGGDGGGASPPAAAVSRGAAASGGGARSGVSRSATVPSQPAGGDAEAVADVPADAAPAPTPAPAASPSPPLIQPSLPTAAHRPRLEFLGVTTRRQAALSRSPERAAGGRPRELSPARPAPPRVRPLSPPPSMPPWDTDSLDWGPVGEPECRLAAPPSAAPARPTPAPRPRDPYAFPDTSDGDAAPAAPPARRRPAPRAPAAKRACRAPPPPPRLPPLKLRAVPGSRVRGGGAAPAGSLTWRGPPTAAPAPATGPPPPPSSSRTYHNAVALSDGTLLRVGAPTAFAAPPGEAGPRVGRVLALWRDATGAGFCRLARHVRAADTPFAVMVADPLRTLFASSVVDERVSLGSALGGAPAAAAAAAPTPAFLFDAGDDTLAPIVVARS